MFCYENSFCYLSGLIGLIMMEQAIPAPYICFVLVVGYSIRTGLEDGVRSRTPDDYDGHSLGAMVAFHA